MSVRVPQFGHAGTERAFVLLGMIAQADGRQSSNVGAPEVWVTNQTYVLREEQGGSLRSQSASSQDTGKLCASDSGVSIVPSANYSFDTGYQRPARPPSACAGWRWRCRQSPRRRG